MRAASGCRPISARAYRLKLMDNQHRKIADYRELGEDEIELMNSVKAYGNSLGQIILSLEQMPAIDKRWLAIGKTDLQKGIMSVVRAIAQPESF
jgi:hypothetical protein